LQYITFKTKDSWIGENEMPKDVLVVDFENNMCVIPFNNKTIFETIVYDFVGKTQECKPPYSSESGYVIWAIAVKYDDQLVLIQNHTYDDGVKIIVDKLVDAYNNNVAAVFSEEDNVTLSFGEEALRVYKVATES
jgi:hypothetical protein